MAVVPIGNGGNHVDVEMDTVALGEGQVWGRRYRFAGCVDFERQAWSFSTLFLRFHILVSSAIKETHNLKTQ